jgi:O-methyltransferase
MLTSIINPQQLNAMVRLAEGAPDGDFVEVGVYHGGSAYLLYGLALRQNRTLHLFDTFRGTPVYTEGLDKHKIDDEFADTQAPKVIRDLMPFAALHIGVYPDTHPPGLKDLAFVHCDCDQYISYCCVIDRMWPLLVPGGIILFDDYPYLEGAKRAVEEHFTASQLHLCFQRYYVMKE